VLIATTGLFDAFFYRIKLSDEFVRRASIESRLEQYSNFLEMIKEEPSRILVGCGTASFPNKLRLSLDLHNGYLRPLGVAGILGFLCFNTLCVLCLRNFLAAARRSDGSLKVVSIFFFAAFVGWSFQAAVQPDDTSVIQWFFFIMGYVLMRSASFATGHNAGTGQMGQIL
jgi:O-antigen ligase